MAAALQPPPQPQKPPINKFIVALFLAKSRPSNSSVRSHILHLESFIRPGGTAGLAGAGIGNVDSVEFWRDSYYKSDAERIEQRVRILALEQQLGRPSAPARATSSQPSMHKKRKRNEDAVEGPNGRVKKTPKTTLNESSPISPDKEIDTIAPGPFASGHREAINFLHNTHSLQRSLGRRGITIRELANDVITVCLDMRRVLASVETPLPPRTVVTDKGRKATTRTQEQAFACERAARQAETEYNLTAIAQAFPLLLNTLDQVLHKPDGDKVSGQITYHLISVARDLLEHLCLLCATEGREKYAAAGKKRSKARAEKLIANYLTAPDASSTAGEGRKPVNMLCQLGIVALNALDLARPGDNDILEGFLFFLLKRGGSLLRDVVLCYDGKGDKNPQSSCDDSEAAAIREAQAPRVLPLLKHAIILSAVRPVTATPTRARSGRGPSFPVQGFHSRPNGLTTKARYKLQNTLLRGVFGDNVTEVGEGLHRPLDVSIETYGAKQVEKGVGVGEWFQDEVWKVVGWDVLMDVVAWE